MTKDLRSYPDMLSLVEENQSILEKVQINVRIQEIPKKMKNHYHIKINEELLCYYCIMLLLYYVFIVK